MSEKNTKVEDIKPLIPKVFVKKKRKRKKKEVYVEKTPRSTSLNEELIKDWKTWKINIGSAGGRSLLADAHRIVHTWWNKLQKGVAMKSPQFKDYSLGQQKTIVRRLHARIVVAMKKLRWNHKSPMGGEEASLSKISPSKVQAQDLEDIDSQYIKDLSDSELKTLRNRIHWLYHNVIRKITEPLENANIFLLEAMRARGMHPKPIDLLDKKAWKKIWEYPKPEGFSNQVGEDTIHPGKGGFIWEPWWGSKDQGAITLEEALEAFPDHILVDEDPIQVYLCGRTVNKEMNPPGHDIDILFKQGNSDERIIHAFLREIGKKNPKVAKKLHFVWDTEGPEIGFSVPLYRLSFTKVSKQERTRKAPKEYLTDGKTITVFRSYKGLKPRSGFHKHEFFEIQEMWDKWASNYISRGIVIQKKYDGMRFQIHVDGSKIQAITEDRRRDRKEAFKKSVPELLKGKKAKSFIIEAEMVEYTCGRVSTPNKEEICTPIKREKMIKWIGAGVGKLDDENVVFHIHDCTYLNGEDIHNKGYMERYNSIKKILPGNLRHWKIVTPTILVKNPRSFLAGARKARSLRGSEGIVAKVVDSKYKMTGRTSEWSKLKNLKEIDVMIWDVQEKKTKAGKGMNQWIYFPVFKIPCSMASKIKPIYLVRWKGQCYAKIGKTYSTAEKARRGDIITVRPIKIEERKDPKGLLYYTWMFPLYAGKHPGKKSPDTIDTVRKIAKMGTTPSKAQLSETEILLPECPFWNVKEICPFRERFHVPGDELSKALVEFLKYPIECRFASKFKCHFVKDYYYSLREEEIEDYED